MLCSEAAGAVASNGLAHFSQGVASGNFDLGDLLGGTSRIMGGQPPLEFLHLPERLFAEAAR
jgi:hypothetical protein